LLYLDEKKLQRGMTGFETEEATGEHRKKYVIKKLTTYTRLLMSFV
jgi:hypothetical protein